MTDCRLTLANVDHERHYIGRDARGVPQRCEGHYSDWALAGESWRETGWTGN